MGDISNPNPPPAGGGQPDIEVLGVHPPAPAPRNRASIRSVAARLYTFVEELMIELHRRDMTIRGQEREAARLRKELRGYEEGPVWANREMRDRLFISAVSSPSIGEPQQQHVEGSAGDEETNHEISDIERSFSVESSQGDPKSRVFSSASDEDDSADSDTNETADVSSQLDLEESYDTAGSSDNQREVDVVNNSSVSSDNKVEADAASSGNVDEADAGSSENEDEEEAESSVSVEKENEYTSEADVGSSDNFGEADAGSSVNEREQEAESSVSSESGSMNDAGSSDHASEADAESSSDSTARSESEYTTDVGSSSDDTETENSNNSSDELVLPNEKRMTRSRVKRSAYYFDDDYDCGREEAPKRAKRMRASKAAAKSKIHDQMINEISPGGERERTRTRTPPPPRHCGRRFV